MLYWLAQFNLTCQLELSLAKSEKNKREQAEKKRTEIKFEKIKKQQKIKERLEICKWVIRYLEENEEEWENDNFDVHQELEKKIKETGKLKPTEQIINAEIPA